MKKIKKLLFSSAIILCLAGSLLTFTACKKTPPAEGIATKNVFAMGMVSASNYFTDNNGAKTATVSDYTKDTIKQYTKMFEGLLQNGINPTLSDTTSSDGEYATYSKKLSISISDETYTMYYNEFINGTTTKIDDDEIESKTTSFLSGKVVKSKTGADSEIFYVIGSREIEDETKKDVTETESELKLIFTKVDTKVSSINNISELEKTLDDCVIIEQETETNEVEFEYTTRTNKIQKIVEIEFETENNNPKLQIEINENNTKTKYEISKVSSNRYQIKLKENQNKTILYLENASGVWSFLDANN